MRVDRFTRESRRAPRVRHDSVLELYDEEGHLTASVLKLVDVSSVGASFSTTHTFAKHAKIRGRLRLLNIGVLEIEGHVVRLKERTNSNLYGMEFDSVRTIRR